uniref:Tumor necrosis factor ligand superfamily member 13B n=1 Tax=Osmerus mordax TaxID=8014 RepID=C1BIL3_OSMMO|nr:Tumor necrosis factor ligand superfamily member 13B [Osmerus mordax]
MGRQGVRRWEEAVVAGLAADFGCRHLILPVGPVSVSPAGPAGGGGGLALPLQERRATRCDAQGALQQVDSSPGARRGCPDPLLPPDASPHPEFPNPQPVISKRSVDAGTEKVSQSCLQMLADSKRTTFQKEFALEEHIAIPWQAGLKRGSALDEESDTMVVREEGYYFVYSQVYYRDPTFAMGHEVIRRKRTVVGDEPQNVILFRCIQNMNPVHPYNTCYTGGIVRLEVGDRVELLIPRSTAIISLDGDSTFLGAIRLA